MKKKAFVSVVPAEKIEHRIYLIRGHNPVLSSSAATTGTTGEQMIQFVEAPKIVYPENIKIRKIGDSLR